MAGWMIAAATAADPLMAALARSLRSSPVMLLDGRVGRKLSDATPATGIASTRMDHPSFVSGNVQFTTILV
jgi:hypothetical protein